MKYSVTKHLPSVGSNLTLLDACKVAHDYMTGTKDYCAVASDDGNFLRNIVTFVPWNDYYTFVVIGQDDEGNVFSCEVIAINEMSAQMMAFETWQNDEVDVIAVYGKYPVKEAK